MHIRLDHAIEIEFDEWQLDQASKVIEKIRQDHRERADDVLKSLLGLLIFGQMEVNKPGTTARVMSEVSKIVKLLAGPEKESA